MDKLGAPGAGLAIALENLFPPLPSEVILPLAGFTAAQGRMSLVAALVWTTVGSVVGALALYGIGALIGRDRIRAIVARLPLVKLADLDRTEAWFARHGTKAVFFGRMIPIFRSLISVPAGWSACGSCRSSSAPRSAACCGTRRSCWFTRARGQLADGRGVRRRLPKAVVAAAGLAALAWLAVRIVKARQAKDRRPGAHRAETSERERSFH